MMPTDETLVRQAADLNDQAAFAELVRRHQQKVLLLQRRLTRDHALAEDLAQETFLRAWEKLGTYRGSGSFGGWLASLSYNVFRAYWRRHGRSRSELPIEEAVLPAPEQDDGHADLERLLGVLPREDQVILVLGYAYGLSNTEVGDVLGMPPGTIKARIHRAKARIREHIDQPTPPAVDQPVVPIRKPVRPRPLARLLSAALPGTLKGAYRS